MEQGTQEWLDWRLGGIGASEISIVMGFSEHKTAFELWQEKKGIVKAEPISTFAKAKGGEVEAQLRARYSLDSGRHFEPVLADYDEFPFIRASLDGYWTDGIEQEAIEIKFVGQEKFDSDVVYKPYLYQMQQQMLVLGLKEITYLKSLDSQNYKKQVVYHDERTQNEIIKACISFWDCVCKNVPPPKTEQDAWEAEGEVLKLMNLYVMSKNEQDASDMRKALKSKMPHAKMIGAGRKFLLDKRGGLRVTALPAPVEC